MSFGLGYRILGMLKVGSRNQENRNEEREILGACTDMEIVARRGGVIASACIFLGARV